MRNLEQKNHIEFLQSVKSLHYLAVLRSGIMVKEWIEFSQTLFFNFVQSVA